jgi:hypothetical protein
VVNNQPLTTTNQQTTTNNQPYLTENASLNLRVTGSKMKVNTDFLRVTISPLAAIPGVKPTS